MLEWQFQLIRDVFFSNNHIFKIATQQKPLQEND